MAPTRAGSPPPQMGAIAAKQWGAASAMAHAEAAHTQARDRAPLWIHVVVLRDGIEERQEGLRAQASLGGIAARRQKETRAAPRRCWPRHGASPAVDPAPFPRAMEKQQQRPALRVDGIRCREQQEVGERTPVRPGPSEGVGCCTPVWCMGSSWGGMRPKALAVLPAGCSP